MQIIKSLKFAVIFIISVFPIAAFASSPAEVIRADLPTTGAGLMEAGFGSKIQESDIEAIISSPNNCIVANDDSGSYCR